MQIYWTFVKAAIYGGFMRLTRLKAPQFIHRLCSCKKYNLPCLEVSSQRVVRGINQKPVPVAGLQQFPVRFRF